MTAVGKKFKEIDCDLRKLAIHSYELCSPIFRQMTVDAAANPSYRTVGTPLVEANVDNSPPTGGWLHPHNPVSQPMKVPARIF